MTARVMHTQRRRTLVGLAGGLVITAALFAFVSNEAAAEQADAGQVSRIKGDAMLARGEAKQPLAEGNAVKVGDVLTTGNDARVEITFLDDTKMTLGADAKLTIDTYLYDPGKSKGSVLLDLAKGAFRFTTGKLAALTNKDIMVKTNFASLSAHVTDFWGGPFDEQNGVVTFKGEVDVKALKGTATLKGVWKGTMIASNAAVPPQPRPGRAEVARAVATVAF
jgi:hypothetical protein